MDRVEKIREPRAAPKSKREILKRDGGALKGLHVKVTKDKERDCHRLEGARDVTINAWGPLGWTRSRHGHGMSRKQTSFRLTAKRD